jgi:hypothetical protein
MNIIVMGCVAPSSSRPVWVGTPASIATLALPVHKATA